MEKNFHSYKLVKKRISCLHNQSLIQPLLSCVELEKKSKEKYTIKFLSIESPNPKPKQSQQPITRRKMSPGSNENLKNLKPEARENAGDQVASGVGSKSDLPRKWREFSKPITHRVRRKTIAIPDLYFRHFN